MSTELKMLAWTGALTSLLWLPYILARIMTSGMMATLNYTADKEALPVWAERAKKAHYNAIENLVPFAVAVLVAHAAGVSTSATATAAVVFFWARLAHFALYISGLPLVRTLTFAVGWLATIVIFLALL